ncbi:MAG: hypothetical protein SFU91_10415 [Chloroherpetonaceae bacterium]|nr:hypothetical protein [Chloroherpetonaceae bacterium]
MKKPLASLHLPLQLCSFGLGVALTQVSLLKDLGYESALISGLILPLIHGYYWLEKSKRDSEAIDLSHYRIKLLNISLSFLLVPLVNFILTLGQQCNFIEGLIWYILGAGLGSVFSVSLATVISQLKLKYPRLSFTTIVFFLLLIDPLWRFWLTPQIFFFNHFFGFFAGSIYDEAISLEPRYFLFRFETLLWSIALISFAFRNLAKRNIFFSLLFSLLAFGIRLFHEPINLSSSHLAIENQLSKVTPTENWYVPKSVNQIEKERIRVRIQREIRSLQKVLNINSVHNYRIYVYADAEEKKRFTGAEETEFTKIWRGEIHITLQGFDRTIRHELVHLMMGEVGINGIGISASIGLIEGIAVAFETPSEEWTNEELSAALLKFSLAPASMESLLSAQGFWGGLSSTSYTLMGSFVKFLIEKYGIEKFKSVYAWANFDEVYGKTHQALLTEWIQYLSSIQFPSELESYLRYVFERQSVFQARCPHQIARKLKEARSLSAKKEFDKATRLFEEVIALSGRSRNAAVQGLLSNELRRITSAISVDSAIESLLDYESNLQSRGIRNQFEQCFLKVEPLTFNQKKQEAIQYQLASSMLWSGVGTKEKIDSLFELVYNQHLSSSFDIASIIGKEINQRLGSQPWMNPFIKDFQKLHSYQSRVKEISDTTAFDFETEVILRIALERRNLLRADTLNSFPSFLDNRFESGLDLLNSPFRAMIKMEWFRLKFEQALKSGQMDIIDQAGNAYTNATSQHPTQLAKRRWIRHHLDLYQTGN